jgi:hypothetical protein
MKTQTLICFVYFSIGLSLISNNILAQATAPNILYTPSTNVYTVGTTISPLAPANSGGAVASFAYGAGTRLTGATLSNPYGMGIDPSGNIYATNFDINTNTISQFSSTGSYIGTFGSSNLAEPVGITFDASGNAYVLNYHRKNHGNLMGNAQVDQYNSSGTFVSTIVQGLGISNGITIDASGNLYVANGANNTVSQYSSTSGAKAFSIASGHTTDPVGVAVDAAGYIYVLDNNGASSAVTKYTPIGTYLSTIITGLTNPNAIYIDGAGDIYVGDSGTGAGTGSVKVYNPAATTILATISGLTDPRGIVTDSKGNLYVSDFTLNTVTKYPPVGGYYLSGILPNGLSFDSTTGTFTGTPAVTFNATVYTVTAYNAIGSGNTTVTLSCPNISGPTISYSPSTNVYTLNSAIPSLSPVTTGTPTTFSISATLPTGLNFSTTTGVISGTPTGTVASPATAYTVTCSNAFGSASTNISVACVFDNFWTGNISTDWNTPGNWSATRVPGPSDLASIGVIDYFKKGNKTNEPLISTADGAVNVDYLTFGATHAATLTVQTGASLTINNILTINSNAAPTFTGTGTGATIGL